MSDNAAMTRLLDELAKQIGKRASALKLLANAQNAVAIADAAIGRLSVQIAKLQPSVPVTEPARDPEKDAAKSKASEPAK